MTKDKRPTQQTELPTIDLAAMQDVTGGAINWKYYAYQAGFAMSRWDPSNVAANFIM